MNYNIVVAMFLRSFSSLVKETLFSNSSHKYKIRSFSYEKACIEVDCEVIATGRLVKMKLDDIIKKDKLRFFSTPDVLILSRNFEHRARDHDVSSNNESKYYNTISTAFIICLLMSNIAEIKICNFFGYPVGAGTIIFPLVYILNDILTEIYGFSSSRKAIWNGFFINCLFSIFLYCIVLLPPSEHWHEQESFEKLFLVSPRIVTASAIGYFVGEMVNASTIAYLKIKFFGKFFGKFFVIRAVFSTFLGTLIESTIFGYIAFYNRIPGAKLIEMIVMLTVIKLMYESLAMPITVKIIYFLKKEEGKDVYEKPSFANFFPKIRTKY